MERVGVRRRGAATAAGTSGPGAPRRAPRRARSTLGVPWIIVVPGVVLALVGHFVAPLAGAWYAFTDWSGIGSYTFVGLDNFVEIFSTPGDRRALVNTLQLAVAFVVLVTVIGLVLALALNKVSRTGDALRSLYFVPAVMIPLSVTQIWKYILDYEGPLNVLLRGVGLGAWARNWLGDVDVALWMILVVMLWQYSGYAMVIMHAGLQLIPNELYEAADLDGASWWGKLRYLTIPLLAPSITVVTILMTITGLRVFDQVLGLTGGGPAGATHTLASYFYEMTWVQGRYGYGTSLALLMTALIVVVGLMQLAGARRREDHVDA